MYVVCNVAPAINQHWTYFSTIEALKYFYINHEETKGVFLI